jgi:NTE family protein
VSLALVLGGSGVAGVAWETGLLLGVQDESPEAADRLLQNDVILGTSAGAIVGAQLGSGVGLADLYARQLSVSIDQTPPRLDVTALMTVFEAAAADRTVRSRSGSRWLGIGWYRSRLSLRRIVTR